MRSPSICSDAAAAAAAATIAYGEKTKDRKQPKSKTNARKCSSLSTTTTTMKKKRPRRRVQRVVSAFRSIIMCAKAICVWLGACSQQLGTHVTYEYSSCRDYCVPLDGVRIRRLSSLLHSSHLGLCVNCSSARNAKAEKKTAACTRLQVRFDLICLHGPYGPSLSISTGQMKKNENTQSKRKHG